MDQKEEYLLENVLKEADNDPVYSGPLVRIIKELLNTLKRTHSTNFSMTIVINALDSLISIINKIKSDLIKGI